MGRMPSKTIPEYACKYEKEIAVMMTNINTIQESIRRQEAICRERITTTADDRAKMTQHLDTLKQISQHLSEFKTTYEPLHEWYYENKDIKENMAALDAKVLTIQSQLASLQVGFAEQVTNILNSKIDQGIHRLWMIFKIVSAIATISGGVVIWFVVRYADSIKKVLD